MMFVFKIKLKPHLEVPDIKISSFDFFAEIFNKSIYINKNRNLILVTLYIMFTQYYLT